MRHQEQHIDALVMRTISTLDGLAASLEQASEALKQRQAKPLGNGRAQQMHEHAEMLKAYRDQVDALHRAGDLDQRPQA